MTGQYPSRHGIIDNTARDQASFLLDLFPKDLQKNGYITGHVGKWHMGNSPDPRPGYDYWISFEGQGKEFNPLLYENGIAQKTSGYITDLLTEKSIQFIERNTDNPFFLYLAHKGIHPEAKQNDDGTTDLSIPKEFIPSIQKGFNESMKNGPLAGYPIESMKVRLFHGSFHDVDSDSLSFELAARMGYKESAKQAGAKLMEPIMAVDVVTPDEYTGPITGDLNRRRGIMKGMDSRQGAVILKADVPLSELFGYVTDLRTMSSGRATASLTFSHYEFVPQSLAEEVVKKAKGL